METTAVERRVLAFVSRSQLERCTCTLVGESCLTRRSERRVNRQSFARPAGAVLKRLVAKGLVALVNQRSLFSNEWDLNWRPTAAGERYIATHCYRCGYEVAEGDPPVWCGVCICEEEGV